MLVPGFRVADEASVVVGCRMRLVELQPLNTDIEDVDASAEEQRGPNDGEDGGRAAKERW